jgi:Mg2+-importing ATPase
VEAAVLVAARQPVEQVLAGLGTSVRGLTTTQADHRRRSVGPNAVRQHRARALGVLAAQVRSPLLVLLAVTAVVSGTLGERTSAAIIVLILIVSVGLGFVNEYRAARAAEALHERIVHTVVVIRDGEPRAIDVTQLVPGDVVHLQLGAIVPADLRLLETAGLQCDESMLTGESVPVPKQVVEASTAADMTDLSSAALMGTVVRAGSGTGVVVATGSRAEFGRLALSLGTRLPETEFQQGLRRFSLMLVQVAAVLSLFIFVTNVALRRPLLDAVLFSLAIAVGITPQLLPAVVSTSLAAGSRRLAHSGVLVKRLVCIEDLGDVDLLLTDKTGTLTAGTPTFDTAVDPAGRPADRPVRLGLLAADLDERSGAAVGGNALDVALASSVAAARVDLADCRRVAVLPFDHERRASSALVDVPGEGRLLVVKGAPEEVMARCSDVPESAATLLSGLLDQGARVVAITARPAADVDTLAAADEHDLRLEGLLVFRDPLKPEAAESVRRLAALGVRVKVATGDHAAVAGHICASLGMEDVEVLQGHQIDGMSDAQLTIAAETAVVFARVSPEQKARVVRALRRAGRGVGFLGDGVNDALALHAADVGISVDSAADVAKDAADIVLLRKDLGLLARGISEGRRTFANTTKYVLMGTSSNFGNMFSAAAASALLGFLPMLPGQILLNNLLYDSSQLAIPSDRVDDDQLARPTHWDLGLVRRFMLFFGTISSLFDFVTFAVLLGPFHASQTVFRTGWFIESMATQTLVIAAVRTRQVPFWRSRPSAGLVVAALSMVGVAVVLPFTPVAEPLGFARPSWQLLATVVVLVLVYLALVDQGKRLFFSGEHHVDQHPSTQRAHRIERRASRFIHR